MGWFFPNHAGADGDPIGHRYEAWYASALDAASDLDRRAGELRDKTRAFSDELAASGPPWLGAECGAQLTTLVASSWWSRDGRFAIWEGTGTCGLQTMDISAYGSHAVALLFPELERSQLALSAAFQLTCESPLYHDYLLAVPDNRAAWESLPAAERSDEAVVAKTGIDVAGRIPHYFPGTLARIDAYHMLEHAPEFALQVLRDALWIGDMSEAARLWRNVVAAMRHQLSLDPAGIGLPYHYPRGPFPWISFTTYDTWEFHGYSSYVSGAHIAALDATRRLAELLGEDPKPWARALDRARASMEELLWDEEHGYYICWRDPPTGRADACCMADQLFGQWWANLCGLEPILDRGRIRRTLSTILRLCWKGSDEGLVNGACLDGRRPSLEGLIEFPNGGSWAVGSQADRPWTGTEYAVASLLIQEGMVDEGLAVAEAVHDRYVSAGNPFSHVEAGPHYYRALSVWTVLTALQGLRLDGTSVRTSPHPLALGSVVVVPGRPLGHA